MTDTELLSRCLSRGARTAVAAELGRLDEAAWASLVDAAIWHGVAPLLHARLLSLAGRPRSPSADLRLEDMHAYCVLHNATIREQLRELLHAADAFGCQVLSLKGAYLAHCAYESAGERSMADIDLLVGSDDIEAFQRHLLESGYAYTESPEDIDYYHLASIAREGSPEVELHRDLAPENAPFRIDVDGLWRRSSRTDLGDFVLPHPALDDVLLHVCVHTAFNHEFALGLRGACDVDAIVARFGADIDWDRMVQTANGDARSRYVYAALRLTRELLDTPIPEFVLRSLQHEAEDEIIVAEAVAFALSTADPIPVTLGTIREATTVASKLRALWRGVFPSREVLRRIYSIDPGSARVALSFIGRPLDLLVRRGRRVLSVIAGAEKGATITEKDDRRRRIRAWARDERLP